MKVKLILTLLGCCMFLAACPQEPNSKAASPTSKRAVPGNTATSNPASGNLLELTPMATDNPNNVGLSRNGEKLLFNILHSSPTTQFVISADFLGGTLQNGKEVYLRKYLAKAFLSSHPDGDRGLIISNYQEPGQPVIDQLIEVQLANSPRVLPYENTPGILTTVPPDDMYGIEAVYSWDGASVIVSLKYSGIVVYDLSGGESRFIEYPELGYPRTGKSIKALEDQNGKRRVLVSVWAQDVYADACKLYTLDLDTLEYKHIADLNWVAYSVGSTDYDNEPWVVTGSRGRETTMDVTRTPLLAMLDPSGSSQFTFMEFYGDPIWQVELSTHGDTVVYLDEQREAIVRLKPLTGEMEVDRQHYNPNGKLLVSADGETVFIWERDELYAADFTEQESFTPYGEE